MAPSDGCLRRDRYVILAKLADSINRQEEMAQYMEQLVVNYIDSPGVELKDEERHLFELAYNKLIKKHRENLKTLSTINIKASQIARREPLPPLRIGDHGVQSASAATVDLVVENYYQGVVEDLNKTCNEVIDLIEDHLEPSTDSSESLVFYLRMKGDCYQCLAEFKEGEEWFRLIHRATRAYSTALDTSLIDLPHSHYLRLKVALSFSVFQCEVMKLTDEACRIAKKALDDAMNKMDPNLPDPYNERKHIMWQLQENYTRWRNPKKLLSEAQEIKGSNLLTFY